MKFSAVVLSLAIGSASAFVPTSRFSTPRSLFSTVEQVEPVEVEEPAPTITIEPVVEEAPLAVAEPEPTVESSVPDRSRIQP